MEDKTLIKLIENNTKAMTRVANAFDVLNDQNAMHYKKDDDRDSTLKSIVAVNTSIIRIFYITVSALVVLSGAEKLFEYLKL